jgi:integrase/recombinase XerD
MIDAVTVTPLRQRMIEDMSIRRFGEHTQRDYARQVRDFTAFLGRSPDLAEAEDRGAINSTWLRSAPAMRG